MQLDRAPRVLVVDDNRDGADTLGLLIEELGNHAHVTYGGANALEVATVFRPDLMLVDLIMPGMDGSALVARLRQIPAFVRTMIVGMTGDPDEERRTSAMNAGFNAVLLKPIQLTELKGLLADIELPDSAKPAGALEERAGRGIVPRLPVREARKMRSQRESKSLTQAESEAAICDGVIRFQEDYLGWKSEQIRCHFAKDLLVIRIRNTLRPAEQQLAMSSSPEEGRDLIKRTRSHLLELARPLLESLVHEVTGTKAVSLHHDLSTKTGEEIVIFSLLGMPRFAKPDYVS